MNTNKKGDSKIKPIAKAPAAFAELAAKINEIIAVVNAMNGVGGSASAGFTVQSPLELAVGDEGGGILTINIAKLGAKLRKDAKGPPMGGGSGGLGTVPTGYVEFDVGLCNGTSLTNKTFLVKAS